jgi:hypothetical protein
MWNEFFYILRGILVCAEADEIFDKFVSKKCENQTFMLTGRLGFSPKDFACGAFGRFFQQMKMSRSIGRKVSRQPSYLELVD